MTTKKKNTKSKAEAKPGAKKKQPDIKFKFDGKFKKWSEIRASLYDPNETQFEDIDTEPKMKDLTIAQELIVEECDAIKDLLVRKNSDYGNSALEEGGVFSDLDPCEALRVRIDDKLKRIRNLRDRYLFDKEEDTIADLIGYLILLRVAERKLGLNKTTGNWFDDWLSKRHGDKE